MQTETSEGELCSGGRHRYSIVGEPIRRKWDLTRSCFGHLEERECLLVVEPRMEELRFELAVVTAPKALLGAEANAPVRVVAEVFQIARQGYFLRLPWFLHRERFCAQDELGERSRRRLACRRALRVRSGHRALRSGARCTHHGCLGSCGVRQG